jgi:pilus assembly protein FimV
MHPMNRSLKLPLLVALALGSTQVLAAITLGQIQVKSTLGSPLVADIPLNVDYPGEADGVTATLASNEDFVRAGISRTDLKVPLTFTVISGAQGQKILRITSSEPVREPYLDFLVQVNYPKGKMLREFTVLLDPPGRVAAAPVQSAPAARNTMPAAAAPAAAPTATGGAVSNGQYGPVPKGDTLSHVARETQIDGVSYQQMLLALKAANPDAFYHDNINALKQGAVLRIPTGAEARALNRAAAIAEVRRQNADWQGATAASPTLVASTGGRDDASTTSAATGAGSGDRLSLVPPGAGDNGAGGSRAGVAGGSSDTAVAGLRQQLARSKEALSSQQQQADELQSRVKDLEAISSKNQRLLSLKDAEIAELQRKLADARKTAGLPPAAPSSTVVAAAVVPAVAGSVGNTMATSASAASPMTAATVMTPAGSASVTASAAANKPASAQATQPATRAPVVPASPATPWYRRTWAMIAGLVILLGLLLIGLLRGRNRPAKPQPGSPLSEQFAESPFGTPGAADDIEAMDDDQRELLEQLAENPDDIGLHLELVSLYYNRGDVDHFEAAAEAMYAHVTDPEQSEWLDVCAMGEELAPGHPLFVTADAEPAAPEDDFDLASQAAVPDEEAPPATPPSTSPSTDYNFEFELAPQTTRPPPAAPAMEEFEALPPLAADEDAPAPAADGTTGGFSDDAVDTKLDLARAYLDMGDPDGARAMLDEVLAEGSQMQKDAARKLLDDMG